MVHFIWPLDCFFRLEIASVRVVIEKPNDLIFTSGKGTDLGVLRMAEGFTEINPMDSNAVVEIEFLSSLGGCL